MLDITKQTKNRIFGHKKLKTFVIMRNIPKNIFYECGLLYGKPNCVIPVIREKTEKSTSCITWYFKLPPTSGQFFIFPFRYKFKIFFIIHIVQFECFSSYKEKMKNIKILIFDQKNLCIYLSIKSVSFYLVSGITAILY